MQNKNYKIKSAVRAMIRPLRRLMQRMITTLLRRAPLEETKIIYEAIKDTARAKTMIDVGACSGGSLEAFARAGWRVYAFEPDPTNRTGLKRLCRRLASVAVDERAVSNKNEKECPFYTSSVSSGISSLRAFHPSHKESETVETVTLDTFCREKGVTEVGFLKIDAEGFDLFVLEGLGWDSIRPEVILCEFEDRKTVPLGYTFHDMAKFLVDKGYRLVVSEWYPVVEYGKLHRWRRFASYPCKPADKNAWGNIIAAGDDETYSLLQKVAARYGRRKT